MGKLKSIGTLLDDMWHLYLANIKIMTKICLWYVVVILIGIVAYFMQPTYATLPFIDNLAAVYTPVSIAGGILSLVNGLIVSPVITVLLGIACTLAVLKNIAKKPTDAQTEVAESLKYLLPVILGSFIFGLILGTIALLSTLPSLFLTRFSGDSVVVGAILLGIVIAGALVGLLAILYLSIKYSFFLNGIVVKKLAVLESFQHSKDIVQGRFFTVAIRLAVVALIIIAVGMILEFVFFGLGLAIVSPFNSQPEILERASVITDFILTQLTLLIILPIQTVALLAVYLDLVENR
jgi:hypothetical protein